MNLFLCVFDYWPLHSIEKCSLFFLLAIRCGGENISGSGSKFNCAARVRASILSPCRPQWSASRTTGVATAKHTVTHLKHFNASIMTSEVQRFVKKINNWLAGKCYIATMLFDSWRAHTFKSSLCVLFFRMVTYLILFIVSFPKSSLSHPLNLQVYFIVVHF